LKIYEAAASFFRDHQAPAFRFWGGTPAVSSGVFRSLGSARIDKLVSRAAGAENRVSSRAAWIPAAGTSRPAFRDQALITQSVRGPLSPWQRERFSVDLPLSGLNGPVQFQYWYDILPAWYWLVFPQALWL